MTIDAMKKFYALCNENAKAANKAGVAVSNIPLMAMFASLIDIIEEMEHRANEEQKEVIKTIAELTKDVVPKETSPKEEGGGSSGGDSTSETLLGVELKSDFAKTILEDLVNLGCESLEDIKWIRAVLGKDCFDKTYYVMVKSRLARLPGHWNSVAISVLRAMMREKNLTLDMVESP